MKGPEHRVSYSASDSSTGIHIVCAKLTGEPTTTLPKHEHGKKTKTRPKGTTYNARYMPPFGHCTMSQTARSGVGETEIRTLFESFTRLVTTLMRN